MTAAKADKSEKKNSKTMRIRQVRSGICTPKDQKATMRRLGLLRIRHSVVKEDRPDIRGMIAKVAHLVSVENVEGEAP